MVVDDMKSLCDLVPSSYNAFIISPKTLSQKRCNHSDALNRRTNDRHPA